MSKDVAGQLTTYVYDTSGQLVGEYRNGSAVAEHVYLNGQPIAVIKQGSVYAVHTDHLGTPRAVTDNNQTVVWRWDNTDPFGANAANDDPDADGTVFEYNKRFAGQYYDAESGLHYNYFRYYDPSTGRYITSDPIGLAGGLNTYGYVGGNPVVWLDPFGLTQCRQTRRGWRCTTTGSPNYQLEEYLIKKLLPPDNVDLTCWAICRLEKAAICQAASLAGAGIGATAGAVASIPSGGTTAPVTVPVGAFIGGGAAWLACQDHVDLNCNDRCNNDGNPPCWDSKLNPKGPNNRRR